MISTQLQIGRVETSHGQLYFLSDRNPAASSRPMVMVLHGALRHSECTSGWLPLLSDWFDVVLVDLPGHGRSPSDGPATIPAMTARVAEFMKRHFAKREVVILGESVGGLVALGLADGRIPKLRGVLVSDPPLTTAKQWALRHNYLKPTVPHTDYLKAFFASAFGYDGEEIIGERIYYSLISGSKVPALILTGDLPLFPVRHLPMQIPCLLDDVDKAIIKAMNNAHVSLQTITNTGHLCLDCTHEEARKAVLDFCAARLPVRKAARADTVAAT